MLSFIIKADTVMQYKIEFISCSSHYQRFIVQNTVRFNKSALVIAALRFKELQPTPLTGIHFAYKVYLVIFHKNRLHTSNFQQIHIIHFQNDQISILVNLIFDRDFLNYHIWITHETFQLFMKICFTKNTSFHENLLWKKKVITFEHSFIVHRSCSHLLSHW